jgi:hypothetical protein
MELIITAKTTGLSKLALSKRGRLSARSALKKKSGDQFVMVMFLPSRDIAFNMFNARGHPA